MMRQDKPASNSKGVGTTSVDSLLSLDSDPGCSPTQMQHPYIRCVCVCCVLRGRKDPCSTIPHAHTMYVRQQTLIVYVLSLPVAKPNAKYGRLNNGQGIAQHWPRLH